MWFCQDPLPNFDTVCDQEAFWLSSDTIVDSFSWLSRANVDMILDAVRLTRCLLDPCSAGLVKAGGNAGTSDGVGINMTLETGVYPEELKEAVAVPLFKKPTLDPMNPLN